MGVMRHIAITELFVQRLKSWHGLLIKCYLWDISKEVGKSNAHSVQTVKNFS
jgi:hypothetical protein